MNKDCVVHEEDYKGFHIIIEQDTDEKESPREWENLGTMVCWHRRYDLGDEQPKCDPIDYMRSMLSDNKINLVINSPEYCIWADHFNEPDDECYPENWLEQLSDSEIQEQFNKYYVVLPLYLYDHSGISMSTSHSYPYNDRWDAGQVGFIYVDKVTAREEFDNDDQKIINSLKGEVKTYDDYLRGNVYGYGIFDIQEDEEYDWSDSLESCWGYYPDHDDKHYYDSCLSEAKGVVNHLATMRDEKLWAELDKGEM